ncbi:MAG: type II secretion system protein [Verrucomicrobiae bacterium]|nr:type II secretion system protein [Verrucomicrobiae bacterium]
MKTVRADRSHFLRPVSAFTLVELLVVLAIVALLAAMLLPSVGKVKEKSRATQCISNLRQWGLAFRLYADDNADYLPRRGQGVQALFQIERTDDWFNALPPYHGLPSFQQLVATSNQPAAKASSVFICPTANDPGGTYFLPYAMNMNLSPRNLPLATRFTEIVRPESVVALADAPGPYSSTFPSTRPYSPLPRHSARVNLLILDGRVRAFGGSYVGCGVGDPQRDDVRWLTGTASDTQAGAY